MAPSHLAERGRFFLGPTELVQIRKRGLNALHATVIVASRLRVLVLAEEPPHCAGRTGASCSVQNSLRTIALYGLERVGIHLTAIRPADLAKRQISVCHIVADVPNDIAKGNLVNNLE